MSKGRSQPVLWLLLFRGLKPKELVTLGYKENTCYTYSARMPEIKAEYKQKLKDFKASREVKANGK